MDINIELRLIGFGITIVSTVLLIFAGFKFFKSSVISLLISDIVIGIVHHINIKNGTIITREGDTTLYVYWVISLLYLLLFIVVYSYRKRTKNCICKCCRREDYLQMEMEQTFCDKYL
jgi:hypothetical protein